MAQVVLKKTRRLGWPSSAVREPVLLAVDAEESEMRGQRAGFEQSVRVPRGYDTRA